MKHFYFATEKGFVNAAFRSFAIVLFIFSIPLFSFAQGGLWSASGADSVKTNRFVLINNGVGIVGTATSIYTQYMNTATGTTVNDGLKFGIAANGTAEIRQQENLSLIFYTNNLERVRIDSLGRNPLPEKGQGLLLE